MTEEITRATSGHDEDSSFPSIRASGVRIIKPKRTIVVEPALVAFVLFSYPMGFVSSLYILDTIRDELAEKQGFVNISHDVNGSGSVCYTNKSDPFYVFQEQVQAQASYFSILLTVASNVPAFFISLYLGAYSDKVGRKYAIILPLFGTLASAVCYVVVIGFHLSINYLFIGAVLNGLGGYFTCMLMGCFSYVADITEPEKRMFRITVIEMSMFASIIMTPIGMGYLVQAAGYLYPFIIVGAGILLDILYVIFFIPETVQKDPNADNRFFTTQPFTKTFGIFLRDNGTNRRWQLNLLMLCFFITALPNLDYSLSTLFQKNEPLCWTAVMIGYFTVVYIATTSLGGVISAKLWKCCLPDEAIVLVACIGAVLLNVYRYLVQNTIMMFCSAGLGVFSVLLIPTIRALMSKLVTQSEQGAIFGAISCVEVVCNLLGTIIFNAIYAKTLYISSGFVFVVQAGFYFCGGITIIIYLAVLYKEKKARKFSQLLIQDKDTDDYDDCNPLIN